MNKGVKKRKRPNTRTTKNNRAKRKSSSTSKPISAVFIFLSGMLLTLGLVFAWIYFKQPELLNEWFPKKVQTDATSKKANNNNKQANSNEQKLDYHQILTNKKLEVKKDPVTHNTSDRTYIMQCGASKILEKAEQLKAEIAFLGLQAKVNEKNGWYRVQLGPYSSKRAAESDNHKLQDNNYNDCKIW